MKKDNTVVKENLFLNLPNVISSLRIAIAPVLVWLAVETNSEAFLWVLAFTLFTDAIDGYLARMLDQVTALGTQLDSWADMVTYAAMLIGLVLIWPEIYASEAMFIMIAFSFWLFSSLVCLARFRCFPNYHTYAAKLMAVASVPAYFLAVLTNEPLYLRVIFIGYLWVAIEQVFITSVLLQWRGNISGIWQAVSMSRDNSEVDR